MRNISIVTFGVALALGFSFIGSADARTRDHYQCYDITTSSTFTPLSVTLKDQFGQAVVEVLKPFTLCAPVEKRVGTTVFPIVDPVTHLVCYTIQSPVNAQKRVRVKNQFGGLTLSVGQATALCVPSKKQVLP